MGEDPKEKKRKTDFDDLQNEMAGREVGRINRFLSPEVREEIKAGKSGRKKDDLSKLQILLIHNTSYRIVYEKAQDTLDRVQSATDRALNIIDNQIQRLQEELDRLEDRAPRLPDGIRVFLSKDGNKAFTENGQELSAMELALVQWDKDVPTWEEYQEVREGLNQALRDKSEIERYQDRVLIPARDRMNDQENPPAEDELREMLDSMTNEMPALVREAFDSAPQNLEMPSTSAAKNYAGDSGMDVPEFRKHFDLARKEEIKPELSKEDQNPIPTIKQ